MASSRSGRRGGSNEVLMLGSGGKALYPQWSGSGAHNVFLGPGDVLPGYVNNDRSLEHLWIRLRPAVPLGKHKLIRANIYGGALCFGHHPEYSTNVVSLNPDSPCVTGTVIPVEMWQLENSPSAFLNNVCAFLYMCYTSVKFAVLKQRWGHWSPEKFSSLSRATELVWVEAGVSQHTPHFGAHLAHPPSCHPAHLITDYHHATGRAVHTNNWYFILLHS